MGISTFVCQGVFRKHFYSEKFKQVLHVLSDKKTRVI